MMHKLYICFAGWKRCSLARTAIAPLPGICLTILHDLTVYLVTQLVWVYGSALVVLALSHMVPAASPTARRLHGRQAAAVSHRAVGLTIYSE